MLDKNLIHIVANATWKNETFNDEAVVEFVAITVKIAFEEAVSRFVSDMLVPSIC